MSEHRSDVTQWGANLAAQHLPRWNELPDIDLYLDQVLTLLDKYLSPFIVHDSEHIITSSMINNYVKLHIVPAPVKKRYNRVQLAYLIVIGMLKQVLPIPDVKMLIESQFGDGPDDIVFEEAYNRFCLLQEQAFSDMAVQLEQLESSRGMCPALALEMAACANAGKTLAEKLIPLASSL